MNTLSPNWITEKHIDFEYKKYLLLAYLTEVNNYFEKNILYPCFSDVIEHYKNVTSLKKHKKFIEESFPVKIGKLDIKNLNLEYERLITDDSLMQEVEQIIDYSIPKFEHYLNEGKKIFDFIEEQISLMPIGLVPLNSNYGYLFLKGGGYKGTRIYEYQITLFETPDEKYRGIHTRFIESYTGSFRTYESIKSDMIRKNRAMPNPATYAIETGLSLPLDQTFLPVAKRLLVKHLSENTAN